MRVRNGSYEKSVQRFEQQSTTSWSASFAAIHGPRATDIRRRCDLQLRVNARQDKRNLSFSLSPIEA